MMRRKIFVGACVLFFGVNSMVFSEDTTVTLKGNTSSSGFAIKDSAGTGIARFGGDGKVGIGTTNPSTALHVVGALTVSGKDVITATDKSNTIIGFGAGSSIATGENNSAFGYQALSANTTGSWNTANGHNALSRNTTGTENTANGERALFLNTTGYSNAANGSRSLLSNTTGNYNTANGMDALYSNTYGHRNTANGGQALYSNASGSNNTALGYDAGFAITASSGNVFLGYQAGYNETGSNKLYIANNSSTTLIYGDFVSGNVGIGTTNPGSYKLYVAGAAYSTGGWSGSDARWKKDVKSLEGSLNNVLKLQGVSYLWRTEEFPNNGFTKERQIGLIAQEVEKVTPELVHTNNEGYKSVSYEKLTAILIEAVKEQQKQINALKAEKDGKIASLEKAVADLKEAMNNTVKLTSAK